MADASAVAGFARADLTTFARMDELGLAVTGQRLEPDRAVPVRRRPSIGPDLLTRLRAGQPGSTQTQELLLARDDLEGLAGADTRLVGPRITGDPG